MLENEDMTGAEAAVEQGLEPTTIKRDAPEPEQSRAALVKEWQDRVLSSREYWEKAAFQRMRRDMKFTAGAQWSAHDPSPADAFNEAPENRYVANIVLRHIQQRTASIYGKDPKVVARRKKRLLSTIWDGTSQSLQTAMMMLQSGVQDPQSLAILQDAQQTMREQTRLKKIGQTLELLFEHEIAEQPVPFKVSMKNTVRRGLTVGVGWVKLGYERVMQRAPEVDARIEETERQLAAMERLSAERAEGEMDVDGAEMERLKLLLTELRNKQDVVVREGLQFTFPGSTSIIPDKECHQLRGFVGANWVAEEFFLSRDRIKEVYQVDVGVSGDGEEGGCGRAYARMSDGSFSRSEGRGDTDKDEALYCVWEIYDRETGLVYVVCDGYKDFLLEPGAPDIYLERFYPWFGFVVNETYDETLVFPFGDAALMRDMQMELNRARQGLREHRVAARPRTYGRKGVLSDDDKAKIETPEPHQHIELDGLQPGENVESVLQPYKHAPVDPALYDTTPAFEDYLRAVGSQEANLGGTSGATATEAAIAEGARTTHVSSTVDDLDEFLSELARAAGAVLLLETPPEKAQQVVGPGAVWPNLSRDEVARELYLDVEASSTGRPNKQQEIQNAQALIPLLAQVPGITPEFIATELIRRLDDRLDPTEAFAQGLPSIQMMNSAGQTTPEGAGPDDPNAQGPEGGQNAPDTAPDQVNAAPRPPDAAPAAMAQY